MNEKTFFENGDRIEYAYLHHLNSKSTTWITKKGTYLRVVKSNQENWANPLVVIKLDSNKGNSTVRRNQISHDLKPFSG